MKAIIPTHHSRAIERIGAALTRFAPADLEVVRPESLTKERRFVEGEADADLLVMYCNGFRNRYQSQAVRCLTRGQRYAIVQVALRTTRHPNTEQWRELWRHAAIVWTYYPLGVWIGEDGGAAIDFNLYRSPLGVDATVFVPPSDPKAPRPFTVCTSGFRRNQEGVEECDLAAKAIGGRVFQLGPIYSMESPTTFMTDISDHELARMYGQCQFVSGLRRHEGFELPAAEGLLCGARPLLFDRVHYRDWFSPWGIFIREESASIVARALQHVFQFGPQPIAAEERANAVKLFDWRSIVGGFWGNLGLA